MKWIARLFAYGGLLLRRIQYSSFANTVRVEQCRLAGAKVGKNLRIRPGVVIKGFKNLTIGDDVYIGERTTIVAYDANITLGSKVLIAENVYISARNHRFRDADVPITDQGYKGSPVVIHDNVWLAHGAIVLAGSEILPRSVIGAGAIAAKGVEGGMVHSLDVSVTPMTR